MDLCAENALHVIVMPRDIPGYFLRYHLGLLHGTCTPYLLGHPRVVSQYSGNKTYAKVLRKIEKISQPWERF